MVSTRNIAIDNLTRTEIKKITEMLENVKVTDIEWSAIEPGKIKYYLPLDEFSIEVRAYNPKDAKSIQVHGFVNKGSKPIRIPKSIGGKQFTSHLNSKLRKLFIASAKKYFNDFWGKSDG